MPLLGLPAAVPPRAEATRVGSVASTRLRRRVLESAALGEWQEVRAAVEEQGCNVNIQDEADGVSLVHWAAQQDDADAVRWLIQQSAYLRLKDRRGNPPLAIAGPAVRPMLLQRAYSPVERVAYRHGGPTLQALVAELDGQPSEAVNEVLYDEAGATLAVHLAALHGQNGGFDARPLLVELARRGADFEVRDEEGNGLLHMIDWSFGAAVALPLLSWALEDAGIEHFDERNREGDTPPMLCAYASPSGSDALQCLRLFEAAGANFALGSAKGMNVAMMLARYHGDGLWLSWCFAKAGVGADATCTRGRTAADYAALHGAEESDLEDT